MKQPTIKVPVSELAPVAEKALEKLRERADEKWAKVIDNEWKKRKDKRWFWIGPLIWPDKEEVEQLLGKVEKHSQIILGTEFAKSYMATRQTDNYKDLVALMKNKPDAIVTLSVEDYNVLMTWND